ncbi:hypothetical protein HRbin41_01411 [bacterium HR41]|nr:hypothetical protein HRbin41_01411 [bacterium HR41]
MRVPASKSIPKLMPSVEIAIAPAAMITPDIEKKSFERPMKSNRQATWRRPIPSADGRASSRERASVPSTAEVASTAVNSEVSVPSSRVKAKPLTPAVASMKRMKATPSVTTLASTIVRSAFEYPADIAAGIDLPARTSSLMRS